jgi:uncharacterized protein YdaU (DUF1376 family)
VNYYRRYSGDYAADTRHLSLVEHGAYALLLDLYYTREAPFPKDMDLNRVCGATTAREKRAVSSVVDQFFPLDGEFRRNSRADKELALARVKIDTARENGRLGGRPRRAEPAEHSRTEEVTNGVTNDTTDSGRLEPNRPETHHKSSPTTNLQPPTHLNQPRAASVALEAPQKEKPELPLRWWESERGMKDAARALGLPNPDGGRGESPAAFRARINAAIEASPCTT